MRQCIPGICCQDGVSPHTRRGGGEVHYDQCQQDK